MFYNSNFMNFSQTLHEVSQCQLISIRHIEYTVPALGGYKQIGHDGTSWPKILYRQTASIGLLSLNHVK